MKNGRMQCKDIPTMPVLGFLLRLERREIAHSFDNGGDRGMVTWFPPRATAHAGFPHSVNNVMPPDTCGKLALAKMRMLLRSRLVDGCGCGCRGDFELTAKGRERLMADDGPGQDEAPAGGES